MAIALSVCALMLFSVWFVRLLGMPRLNVISVFGASWITMIVTASLLGGVSDDIAEFTWVVVLTGWFCLLLGAVLGWFLGRGNSRPRPTITVDIQRTIRVHLAFTTLFCIYLVIQLSNALPLIQASGGWSVILDAGANGYRSASLQQSLADSQTDLSGGVLASVVNYATYIPGMLAIYTGVILWKANRRILALLPVILSGMLSLLTMQRTSIVLVALLFVFGTISLSQAKVELRTMPRALKSTNPHRVPRSRQFGAVVGGVALLSIVGAFLLVTTNARSTGGGTSSLRSAVGEYLVGGLAGLNSRSLAGSDWAPLPSDIPGMFDPSPGMGGYTFTGMWSVLARLGVPVETTRTNLDFTPVTLFGESTITNVVSAFGEFYLDFRMPGVIVLAFLLGFITTLLHAHMLGSGRVALIPAVAFLLTFSFWSFFVAWTSDFRQLLVAAFGGLIVTWAVRARSSGAGASAAATAISASTVVAREVAK